MKHKIKEKDALKAIKEDGILNSASWKVICHMNENLNVIYLYPDKSVFCQRIEDGMEEGYFRKLNIRYKNSVIHMTRGYLSSIDFYSTKDVIQFIKDFNLKVDFEEYLKSAKMTLGNYNNSVNHLKNCIKEVEEYTTL